jgi:uncharacterized protein YycO
MYTVDRLQPGDVILVAHHPGEGCLDRAIEWATVSPWHHAAMVGVDALIQAVWRVDTVPLDTYAATGWAFRVQATPNQRQAAVAAMSSKIGRPYGLRELLEDGARAVKIPIGAKWIPKYYTCSGLVAWAYAQAGVRLTYAPLPSPADLSYSPLLIGRRP